ncbi:hypothetical protein HPP92_002447 [Vanilla planifolia]|uniref:UBX domain-containing protein n=1 Tax=Vanilla planifolia TaxID=51239 RepID=A0A835VMD5_VANPL|nr:hypothetical protein HPP92_002447 [Vanilla planifolia]
MALGDLGFMNTIRKTKAIRGLGLGFMNITSEDENSTNLENSTWVDGRVAEAVSRYCIFLHLIEGHIEALQFSSIYPQKSIPSISAVGYNGVMLWQNEGYIKAENFVECIEKSWAAMHFSSTYFKGTRHPSSGNIDVGPSEQGVYPDVPDPSSSADHSHVVEVALSNDPKKLCWGNSGISLQAKFTITDTLRSVNNYVDHNQGSSQSSYDLAIPHPRAVFVEEDMSKSLGELGISGRQAMIVIPRQQAQMPLRGLSSSNEVHVPTTQTNTTIGYFGYLKRVLSYMNPFSYFAPIGGGASRSEQAPNEPWQYRQILVSAALVKRERTPSLFFKSSQLFLLVPDASSSSGRDLSRPLAATFIL